MATPAYSEQTWQHCLAASVGHRVILLESGLPPPRYSIEWKLLSGAWSHHGRGHIPRRMTTITTFHNMGVNGASVSTSVFANQGLVGKYGSTSVLCCHLCCHFNSIKMSFIGMRKQTFTLPTQVSQKQFSKTILYESNRCKRGICTVGDSTAFVNRVMSHCIVLFTCSNRA